MCIKRSYIVIVKVYLMKIHANYIYSCLFCRMTTPDGAQLVVGDVEWLDGLGVHLPGPSTSPSAAHNEISGCDVSAEGNAEITQNLACQGNRTEVSESYLNARSQCCDENTNLLKCLMSCPERKSKSKEFCNHPLDNDESGVDQMCIDAPCCAHSDKQTICSSVMQCECAKDECKCHVVDNSSKVCIPQQQEQPSFLVLAAGVLNEPGRLFTLWWAQSRHIHKCKKE